MCTLICEDTYKGVYHDVNVGETDPFGRVQQRNFRGHKKMTLLTLMYKEEVKIAHLIIQKSDHEGIINSACKYACYMSCSIADPQDKQRKTGLRRKKQNSKTGENKFSFRGQWFPVA